MPIRVLSEALASQIAAGEVVERPASVVKELIENALDAGANQIQIRVEGAGQRLIEVSDDGQGIPMEEISLALHRHATSKIASAEDLAHINTLGFRGEALAAMASVARLTLISRTAAVDTAAILRADAGHAGSVEAIGAPPGTSVRIEELFFNIPARRKFLKSDITERRQISQLVARYALAYPAVRFSLEMEGQATLNTSGRGDRREVLSALYDSSLARRLIEVDASGDEIGVTGFISPMDLTRANRSDLTFFVNGRWVQDTSLAAAALQAYHGMLMVGRFPVVVLFLRVPLEMVDVNVHPTKAEVRFSDRDKVFSAVQRAVRRSLLANSPLPNIEPVQPGLAWRPLEAAVVNGEPQRIEYDEVQTPVERPSAQHILVNMPLLRPVGQVGSAYLVAEGPDGLYLIDQHAAHERVLFERLQAQQNHPSSQTLLEPATLELPAAQAALLETELEIVRELGFEIEPFGPNTYKIRAIPTLLLGSDPEAALRAVVEDFEEDETPLEKESRARLAARICKRVAVKAGQTLSVGEQRALLRDLEECSAPRTCPHGRPTMIHLSIDLLERQFGRQGAK